MEAKFLNNEIFKELDRITTETSRSLAQSYGEPPLLEGYGLRNTTRMAIAPTVSSSFILGQSSSGIEPYMDNYYVEDTAKGGFIKINPHLKKLLEELGRDTKDVWDSILLHGGSVQHLDFLTEHQRNVYKTFGELSQKEIVIQAAQRQKYIDQSQSLNLLFPAPRVTEDSKHIAKQVSDLLKDAWRLGVKSIYYRRGTNPAQQAVRDINTCTSCQA
jgi:ribonucleoside-diphosphate reductase alpha chain